MIRVLVLGHVILALLFLAWMATRPWRIALAALFCSVQVATLTFGLDVSARAVLAAEARNGFKTPSWEVVRKVRDAHNLDRLCAGVAGVGLFVLVAHRRRSRPIDTACDARRSQ